MLICPLQKYCWIEVPKTGSSALTRGLKGRVFSHPMRHVSGHKARDLLGAPLWTEYDSWAVMREPFDWVASWFRFFAKADDLGQSRDFSLHGATSLTSLSSVSHQIVTWLSSFVLNPVTWQTMKRIELLKSIT